MPRLIAVIASCVLDVVLGFSVELLACLRAKSVADLIPSVISWLGEEGETALNVQKRMQPLKDALGMAGLDWVRAVNQCTCSQR